MGEPADHEDAVLPTSTPAERGGTEAVHAAAGAGYDAACRVNEVAHSPPPAERAVRRLTSRSESKMYGRSWSRYSGYGSSMPDSTVITITRRDPSSCSENGDIEAAGRPNLHTTSIRDPLLENQETGRAREEAGTLGDYASENEGPHGSEWHLMQSRIKFAMNASLAANVLLLIAKIAGYFVSRSKAVLASTADSFVDIASQLVLAVAEHAMKRHDPRFPVGRTRLEAVGVVACAVIMTLATIEVIQSAAGDLWTGFSTGVLPELEMGPPLYIILGTATGIKLLLLGYCQALASRSDSIAALAEDHRNDIASNLGAIVCGAIASLVPRAWWVDPAGAILISVYIIVSWGSICKNQMDKIVGAAAPEDFVAELEELANTHHDLLEVDVIRAFHWGARFIVEMEVILPEHMSVRESHDIALKLQHKLEAFEEVERAFVHVDYERRDEPEHKVDRNLAQNASNIFDFHPSVRDDLPARKSSH